jgi:hypothetical protein
MNLEKLGGTFKIVGLKNAFPKVTLVDPSNSGYLTNWLNCEQIKLKLNLFFKK